MKPKTSRAFVLSKDQPTADKITS
ncbi:hypothetical protein RCCS2_13004 [Roseobacter sp. CCS2]|nr:hypothetical protein RCCS2_13004 [Roseobacter sp. CCS2]